MRLSDDLLALEAWVAIVQSGSHEMTPEGIRELRTVLGSLAEQAAVIERTLESTAEQLSPCRNHAAVAEAMAAGKVELLAAHRIRRLPDLPQPGWIA